MHYSINLARHGGIACIWWVHCSTWKPNCTCNYHNYISQLKQMPDCLYFSHTPIQKKKHTGGITGENYNRYQLWLTNKSNLLRPDLKEVAYCTFQALKQVSQERQKGITGKDGRRGEGRRKGEQIQIKGIELTEETANWECHNMWGTKLKTAGVHYNNTNRSILVTSMRIPGMLKAPSEARKDLKKKNMKKFPPA